MNLVGNFTALITPLKQNLEIDFNALKKLCDYQVNNLTDGIVALGSTAEATALNNYEKHKIMETITKTIDDKIPVIAGINAFTLQDALYQCDARFLDGATALLISPPPYIKPSQIGLIDFYTKIANHSFIPIILYNIPSRTSTKIEESTIVKLSAHPNIIGIKDASGDISTTQNTILKTKENNFSVLAGNDNHLIPILALGGSGIISVAGNIIPKIMHDIVYLYTNNKTCEANQLYFKYLDLINNLSLETNPICIKYLMSKLGFIKNNLRPPLTKLSKKNAKTLLSSFNNLFTNI